MGGVIGGFLPFALGIAISPLPIIVAILTLMSPRSRRSSAGFLLGWTVGLLIVIGVLAVLSGFLPASSDAEPGVVAGIIKLALGALLLWLSVGQWRKRADGDATAELPGWMRKVDELGFGGALRLGLFLSIVNPKNVIFSLSAAIDIGSADLEVGESIIAVAVFALIAASTVLIPVVGYALAADRLGPTLTAVHAWLNRENHTIMCVLFLVLGASALGGGLEILWSR